MGDEGDFWADVKPAMQEESKQRRKSHRENAPKILAEQGVHFESKSGGVHLIVSGKQCKIDFWPGTGKWIERRGKRGRGIFNMLKRCHCRPEVKK